MTKYFERILSQNDDRIGGNVYSNDDDDGDINWTQIFIKTISYN